MCSFSSRNGVSLTGPELSEETLEKIRIDQNELSDSESTMELEEQSTSRRFSHSLIFGVVVVGVVEEL